MLKHLGRINEYSKEAAVALSAFSFGVLSAREWPEQSLALFIVSATCAASTTTFALVCYYKNLYASRNQQLSALVRSRQRRSSIDMNSKEYSDESFKDSDLSLVSQQVMNLFGPRSVYVDDRRPIDSNPHIYLETVDIHDATDHNNQNISSRILSNDETQDFSGNGYLGSPAQPQTVVTLDDEPQSKQSSTTPDIYY